jgi:sulfide:quinone oxidoreductase
VRKSCKITRHAFSVPATPDTSQALLKAFQERDIDFIPKHLVRAIDPIRHVAILDESEFHLICRSSKTLCA